MLLNLLQFPHPVSLSACSQACNSCSMAGFSLCQILHSTSHCTTSINLNAGVHWHTGTICLSRLNEVHHQSSREICTAQSRAPSNSGTRGSFGLGGPRQMDQWVQGLTWGWGRGGKWNVGRPGMQARCPNAPWPASPGGARRSQTAAGTSETAATPAPHGPAFR